MQEFPRRSAQPRAWHVPKHEARALARVGQGCLNTLSFGFMGLGQIENYVKWKKSHE